jgi:hypothetical protein
VATTAVSRGLSRPDASIAFTRNGLPASQPPQRVPGANQGGIEKKSLSQIVNGRIFLAPGLLEVAAVFVGQRINRIDRCSGTVVLHCSVEVTLPTECETTIIEGSCTSWIQPYRLGQIADGGI